MTRLQSIYDLEPSRVPPAVSRKWKELGPFNLRQVLDKERITLDDTKDVVESCQKMFSYAG